MSPRAYWISRPPVSRMRRGSESTTAAPSLRGARAPLPGGPRPPRALEGHVEMPAVVLAGVRLRPPGHQPREVVTPAGVRHAERPEDPLLGECLERLTAHPLDDGHGEGVAGVGV